MRSRIPFIIEISEGNMKFDLLIYKDPHLAEQSAIDIIMAKQERHAASVRMAGAPALKSPRKGKNKKRGDQAGHPSE